MTIVYKQPKDDPANWDVPGGWCTQCGNMISTDDLECQSSQCNPPGEDIRRSIKRRIEIDRETRRTAVLETLMYYTDEAKTVEDLKQVVLTLLKEFKDSL